MSGSPEYRVRPTDGLPKVIGWREWLNIVFSERPDRTVLAGVIAFDRGDGREAHALAWVDGEARAYRLADEADALPARLTLADRDRLAAWVRADARGEFAAALSRSA